MRGAGTALNVATVLIGSAFGVAVGGRLAEHTRRTVTDGLGLVALLIAATQISDGLSDRSLRDSLGNTRLLMVLGAVLVGGLIGSALRLEARLETLGAAIQRRVSTAADNNAVDDDAVDERQRRFVDGFVVASLVFCAGPLTILGSLQDGLGEGIELLALKSVLDGFASLAFAASFGWGVAASALTVIVVQGTLTVVGVVAGGVVAATYVAAVTLVGGLLLVAVALRLLDIRSIAAVNLLPALVVAPLLTWAITALR